MSSICLGCYFHRTGYLYNSCAYFEAECYKEPEECDAFSKDGFISSCLDEKIYVETNGAFGTAPRLIDYRMIGDKNER